MDAKNLYREIYGESKEWYQSGWSLVEQERFAKTVNAIQNAGYEIVKREEKPQPEGGQLKFTVVTDGACSGNPGPGGWAYWLISNDGDKFNLSGRLAGVTTNNRMELQAIIEALSDVKSRVDFKGENFNGKTEVVIITDSEYVINAMTNEDLKIKANLALLKELSELVASLDVIWIHTKNVNDEIMIRYHSVIDRAAKREAHGKIGFPNAVAVEVK